MFPNGQEKVKERDWTLPWNTQLYIDISVFRLNCFVTLKKGVYDLRDELDLLFVKLLIISQNLIYNLIKSTCWLQNTQHQQHLWEDNGK